MVSSREGRENASRGCKSGPGGVALFLSDVTASYCICILYRIVKSLSPQSVSGFGGSHIQWLDCVGHPHAKGVQVAYTRFDLTCCVPFIHFLLVERIL